MDFRRVFSILSFLLLCLSGTLLLPLGVSYLYGEPEVLAFFWSFVLCGAIGGAGYLLLRTGKQEITHREGFAIVGLGWVLVCLLGAVPFQFAGTFPHFLDAFFESTSGFTTTGATVLDDIEVVPRGILFWRSLTHWVGGMGIILFSMAILPMLGVGGMQLYRAEVPGPVPDRLKPRIRETAKTLWLVYVLISLLEAVLLMVGGMSLFDSVCHTFGTMATGGFSTRNASIGAYHSAYVDWVITLFMLIAGANFALHYLFLTGRSRRYVRDPEFRFYLFITVGVTLVITLLLRFETYPAWNSSLRSAAFQVVSILTTTGYTTADYEQWSRLAQFLLLTLMFVGGCAGSTAGSVKCVRILLLAKLAYREVYHLIHPHAISPIKLGRESVPPDVMESVTAFFLLYMGIFLAASTLLSFFGLDVPSALSAVAASLGNVGPGLGAVGPTHTYAAICPAGKWVLIACMLLGRLEIFTLLVLFVPEFWRK